mgnify:CR=1 FL=1
MTPLNCAECGNKFVDGDHIYRVTGLANFCDVCEECFQDYIIDTMYDNPQKMAEITIETETYRPYE